jgi:hypothetical protein
MELKIKRNPGKILRNNYLYYDQLSFIEIGRKLKFMNKYIKDTYNITPSQYYNLIVYNDLNKIHYCEWCGKETEFMDLRKGFKRFCNKSCVTNKTLDTMNKSGTNKFKEKSFIEENRIRVSKFQRDRIKSGLNPLLTEENFLNASKSRYLKYGYKETSFYVAEVENSELLKIGVSKFPWGRRKYLDKVLINHKVIRTDKPEIIINIEDYIKRNFCIDHEFIDKNSLNSIINFVENYQE